MVSGLRDKNDRRVKITVNDCNHNTKKNKGTEENNQDSPWLYLFSYVEQVGMNELMTFSNWRPRMILGTLSKPRWGRQRGHGKTKDLIGRTIAQLVRFKTLYIS